MIEPKIKREKPPFLLRKCAKCGQDTPPSEFLPSHSIFHQDKRVPICNSCLREFLKKNDWSWRAIDKICQFADTPFIPKEWERLKEQSGDNILSIYFQIFQDEEYNGIDWSYYFKQFKELREAGVIEDELPELKEKKFKELKRKWGANYDDEELLYLEDLYAGLSVSQNINGALQVDQAKKLCKLSLEIDSRIRSGEKDIDKILTSYDKVIKTAEFTPKNAKNATDFDSIGELAYWLEKRGFVNKFYDQVSRDIIDETLKNIQSYNQKLYTNESSIGEEITARINALKSPISEENYYDTNKEYDLEAYELEVFKEDGDFEA